MNALTNSTGGSPTPGAPGDITDVDDAGQTADTRGPIRLGFWVLIVGFGLFLAWAAWAPLDEGVSAGAVVSVENRRKTIQHVQGGIIQQVVVKEGAEVKPGDVLLVLDDGTARAAQESIRQNYLGQRATESRLIAEASRAASITFHPDLTQSTEPYAAQHMAVQQQLFASRKAAQAADIAAAQQSIVGLEGQVAGLKQMIDGRRAQQALQARQVAGVKSLAADGFAPRNQALQLEQQQAELQTTIADLEANVLRVQSSAAEARLRLAQRQQEYLKEISTQLADVRREVQANQERLAAVTAEFGRMQIKSPVAGQVIGLQVSGVGGVVQPGQHLMDILPRGESMLLDVKIPPHVIDRVKVGDAVEVRFSAFSNSPQLVVHGKLVSLSGDAVSESVAGMVQSFYLARVVLTPEGLKALGDRVVQPGMTGEVLIKTGERSMLTYLLHPLLKRLSASMTEE
ncbi:HlyD family type I secretion periplasmic adaptor subunit [Ideonella sp. A 288]|uniref:HlyD family type I secretion periplasmic adaptor subunit n=1 Tax=Ideonella sp. A 288 TaxID=1962181 RepID=UPI000B4B3CE3|nr:HlyD family type I secretion periplasmic adaptor subunit [Ideonella sp. A 288]